MVFFLDLIWLQRWRVHRLYLKYKKVYWLDALIPTHQFFSRCIACFTDVSCYRFKLVHHADVCLPSKHHRSSLLCHDSSSVPVHKQLLAPPRMLVQEINIIIAAAPFCFLLAMLYFLPQVLPFILLMLWIGHHSAISWPNKFTKYQPSCVSWTNWWARSSPFVVRSLIGLAFLKNLLADT